MTNEEFFEETHYCEVHPDRETELRCNKCNRYMCAQCAVQTPVGYRCRECVHQVEDHFFTAASNDVYIILAVSFITSAIAGALMSFVNFSLLGALLGFPAGGIIAQFTLRAVQNRRGRNSGQLIATGVVLGGFIGAALRYYFSYPESYKMMVQAYESIEQQVPNQYTLSGYLMDHTLSLGLVIFIALAAYAAYYRMKS